MSTLVPDEGVDARPMAGGEMLLSRDPMLFHAVAAHGGEWRPDLTPTADFPFDDVMGLPEIRLTTSIHQISWRTPSGWVTRHQEWLNGPHRDAGWHATATMPDGAPETVVAAMVGRTLDEVIEVPGADAWRIVSTGRMPGFHVSLVLERAR